MYFHYFKKTRRPKTFMSEMYYIFYYKIKLVILQCNKNKITIITPYNL